MAVLLRRKAPDALDVEDKPYQPISHDHHDLIVRYALVGIFVIMATACLSITKTISLPLATGVVFGMVLGPAVDWIVARGVPQQIAAGVVVIAGVFVMIAAAALLALPLATWSGQFPTMLTTLQAKFSGVFNIIASMLQFGSPDSAAVSTPPAPDMAGLAAKLPLLDIAATSTAAGAGILIFVATVYFYLATRRHMKARVLRLCLGREARRSAGHFFTEIEERVATYLGLVTVINAVCGVLATAIAWAAGLPQPIFWGAFAFVMNYLPFVGPAIVIVLLFAAGLVGDATVLAAIWPAALYFAVHLLESNLVTPMIIGRRLTMSPFLVFVSFVFWLWLWGPVGAVLATPILIIAIVARETFEEYRAEVEAADAAA